jgi:Zn-dependent metalloprotease
LILEAERAEHHDRHSIRAPSWYVDELKLESWLRRILNERYICLARLSSHANLNKSTQKKLLFNPINIIFSIRFIMISTADRPVCCSITPPSILKHIAESGTASERSKLIANKTLGHVSAIHQARVDALADSAAPQNGAPGEHHAHNIVPSYTYQSIVGSDNTSDQAKDRARAHLKSVGALKDAKTGGQVHETLAKPAKTKHLFREIHDAQQRNEIGTELFHEGHVITDSDDKNAVEVYVQLKQVFDFYFEVFGRNSINDKGLNLVASVHYDDDNGDTTGFDNAFWDGIKMAFGDGDAELFGSFTKNLDVTGHELTHGVTEKTGQLEFEFQAGALNESMSDCFGSMVKQYFSPNGKQTAKEADWLIGEGLLLVPGARALRDMANPGTAFDNPQIGKDPQPGHMKDYQDLPNTAGGDWGGVHTNSGIPNRAFYLVATSVGTYSWDVAGKIWYASLTDAKLRGVSSKNVFKLFADLTVKHALEIGGDEATAAVKKAWTTVGVYEASHGEL